MTVSAITGITQEGQPQELSSFLRAGVVYVMWHSSIALGQKRLSWKPHNAANFTEVIPTLGQPFSGLAALYDPGTDHVVTVWDDGAYASGFNSGSLNTARFDALTGTLISGPTFLFPGSNPKLAYRSTTANSEFLLWYRTAKNLGVYGRVSADGGLTWESGYPLWTGQVSNTSALDVAAYSSNHASIGQIGVETKQLVERGLFLRTRPLVSIVQHPTVSNEFFVGEPSKFDNVTLTDNLRGALVLSTDNTKLYNLDGVQQGTSDSVGAVARVVVTGTTFAVAASAGPTGNGDDLREYTLTPGLGTLNVDLPGTSYAVDMAVSSTHAYIAEYSDSSTAGQFVVLDLSSGTTATVLSALTGVRAVAVANFLSPPRIFVATTESGAERLRVYEQNALAPVLILNTKLTSRANALSVAVDPSNPTGALVYASLTDRLNVYRYVSSSAPVQLEDTLTLPGGGSFFRSKVASHGNIFVAAGNAGLLCLNPDGKILAQTVLSGKVVAPWDRATVYSAGALVRPREQHQFAKSRYYFRTTAGGTSGGSEPSWAPSGPVTDNTVSWTAVGLTDGVAVSLALDEMNKRVLVVGNAGGNLGTDGRVWLVNASGLLRSSLPDGLAAFYKLSGNGLDSLGVHHGTGYGAFGAASPPGYYVTGKDGQGFSMSPGGVPITPFDGWWQTRMDLSPAVALGTSWTLSCWLNMGGTITGHPPDLVITQAAFGYGMRVAYGGKISWGDFVTQSTTNVSAGWHMITETYDGTTLRYYLDGVPDGTSVSVLPSFSPDRFFSSQFDRSSKSYVLDEVGMWTRPLSPSEVVQLYNGGAGFFYPF